MVIILLRYLVLILSWLFILFTLDFHKINPLFIFLCDIFISLFIDSVYIWDFIVYFRFYFFTMFRHLFKIYVLLFLLFYNILYIMLCFSLFIASLCLILYILYMLSSAFLWILSKCIVRYRYNIFGRLFMRGCTYLFWCLTVPNSLYNAVGLLIFVYNTSLLTVFCINLWPVLVVLINQRYNVLLSLLIGYCLNFINILALNLIWYAYYCDRFETLLLKIW